RYSMVAATMSLYGLLRNWFWRGGAAGSTAPRRPARGRVSWCWLAGQAGQGLEGEVPGGDGLEQVVHGADELPFGAGCGVAADGELADAHVVLDLAVRGLGDVAALPVGRDPVFGFQPFAHRPDGRAAPVAAAVLAAGGFFQVPVLAGRDQPVRTRAGQVGFRAVSGIGQRQP